MSFIENSNLRKLSPLVKRGGFYFLEFFGFSLVGWENLSVKVWTKLPTDVIPFTFSAISFAVVAMSWPFMTIFFASSTR